MKKLMQIKKYLPEIAFVALMCKVLATGAGLPESLALISLVSSMAYTKWLNKYKDERYDRLEKTSNSKYLEMQQEFSEAKTNYDERIKLLENRVSSLFLEKGVKVINEEAKPGPAVGIPGIKKPGRMF